MDLLLEVIDKHFPDCPVLLAGSHAIGRETLDSDVDLLIFTNEVQIPVITFQEIEGFKIEAIEIPLQNALYFLERTANDSGAYVYMLAMGKVLRDQNGYLADLKEWGDKRFLAGPPKENRSYKIHRGLIDITNLLTDLEGEKLPEEKVMTANRLISDLMNLLFQINDLFPMTGKWVYRKLDPIYPGLITNLFTEFQSSIGEKDYSGFVKVVDDLILPLGGRKEVYSSTISGDRHLKTGILQIILPGVKLANLKSKAFQEIQQLKKTYNGLYLKDFDEGGIGIAIPEVDQKITQVFKVMEGMSPKGNAKFTYEPILKNLYGGIAYYPIAEEYFRLTTDTVFEAVEKFETGLQSEHVLEICAYLIPIFCSNVGVPKSEISQFAEYLIRKWIIQAADPFNESTATNRKVLVENLQKKLDNEVLSADPDLKEIMSAVLSDHELRFEDSLFDKWADGVFEIGNKLKELMPKERLSISKFQLLATFTIDQIQENSLLWPVYEHYLTFLFNLLDIYKTDRVYFASLLKEVGK